MKCSRVLKLLFIAWCLCSCAVYAQEHKDDLSDYQIGTIFDTVGTHTLGDWEFIISADGDSVSVDIDPISGKKAFKIRKGMGEESLEIIYRFPQITSHTATVSFDARAQNHSKSLARFPAIRDASGTDFGRAGVYDDGYWLQQTGDANAFWIGDFMAFSNQYGTFESICNFSDATYQVKTYLNGTVKNTSKLRDTTTKSIENLRILISTNAQDFKRGSVVDADTTNNPNNDGIYWISGISVKQIQLGVETTNTSDETDINAPIQITLDNDIDETQISKSTVKLMEENTHFSGAYDVACIGRNITLTVANGLNYGKKYQVVLSKDILPADSGVLPLTQDYVVEFQTKSIAPKVSNISNDARYNIGIIPAIEAVDANVQCEITISKDGGPFNTFTLGTALTSPGNYVLRFNAQNTSDNKSQLTQLSFEIIGIIAPKAQNVVITGQGVLNGDLVGSYDFIDENGEDEGTSTFRWLECDTLDGQYTEIAGANGSSYTLTEGDVNKYLKFEVTPISMQTNKIGDPVLSDAFGEFLSPTVEELTIEGEAAIDKNVSVDYQFISYNGGNEGDTIITWFASTDKMNWIELAKGANMREYTFTANDADKFIKASIVPYADKFPFVGTENTTEIFIGPFTPNVSDVRITGTARVGQTVGAQYAFSDLNNDAEGTSLFKWYLNGTVVSAQAGLAITSDMAGQTLQLEVIPVSKNAPYQGVGVKSDSVSIPSNSSSNYTVSGYSSAGGGGSSMVVTSPTPISTDKPSQTENKQDEQPTIFETAFTDIATHWARKSIEKMEQLGIVNGVDTGIFAPDNTVTRAEVAAMLTRALNLSAGEVDFHDVSDQDWYYASVGAILHAGYMNGSDQLFRPNDMLSRQELAVVISNITGAINDQKQITFNDHEDIAPWAQDGVYGACSIGILQGMDDGTFAPLQSTTRAQLTVVIARLLEMEGYDK